VTVPNPEFRRRVRELVESQWHESVVVVFLEGVKPDVEVPGRRKDGTVKGKRLVRRFFWNILRGTVGGLFTAFLLIQGGSLVNHSSDFSSPHGLDWRLQISRADAVIAIAEILSAVPALEGSS
jgi:hypothetical protein